MEFSNDAIECSGKCEKKKKMISDFQEKMSCLPQLPALCIEKAKNQNSQIG